MNLVDLNGRQDEPAVLEILRQAHGSKRALEEARAHYRSGEWPLIGWQEGDEMVACAGAEEDPDATIGIRSIVVAPDWRNRGLARGLIDALAERMGAQQVIAETDDDAVRLLRPLRLQRRRRPSQVRPSALLVRSQVQLTAPVHPQGSVRNTGPGEGYPEPGLADDCSCEPVRPMCWGKG